jgi:hypothetical protein
LVKEKDMQNEINEKIELGGKIRVWVGDPCYVIPDELWDEVCKQIFAGTNHEVNQVIKFEFRDLREAGVSDAMLDNCACRKLAFIQCGTMYGDGVYQSMSDYNYGVDAGCLAAVPDYLIDPSKIGEAERLGKFFDALDFIALLTDGKGIFTFYDANGPLEIIETGYEETGTE